MTDGSGQLDRSESDRDRYYVQLDKHPLFQAWGKDDESSPLPTLKDAFVFAACMGWARERRMPLKGRQHVGFWRTFDSRDASLLYAIAIADTGDPSVVANQGTVIRIAEEYANGGIDLLLGYDRADRDRTLVALAGLISETSPRPGEPRVVGQALEPSKEVAGASQEPASDVDRPTAAPAGELEDDM